VPLAIWTLEYGSWEQLSWGQGYANGLRLLHGWSLADLAGDCEGFRSQLMAYHNGCRFIEVLAPELSMGAL
jgi:hypothetical protein